MTPREIDALVAERVFGIRCATAQHIWADGSIGPAWWATGLCKGDGLEYDAWMELDLPDYSTDISAAWQVVEKMHKDGWWLDSLRQLDATTWGVEFVKQGASLDVDGHHLAAAETAPLAICLAALRAKGVEV